MNKSNYMNNGYNNNMQIYPYNMNNMNPPNQMEINNFQRVPVINNNMIKPYFISYYPENTINQTQALPDSGPDDEEEEDNPINVGRNLIEDNN